MGRGRHHETRMRARKMALQVLYQSDIREIEAATLIDDKALVPETQALDDYALELIKGTCDRRADLDARISSASENWSMDRMPVVDRSLLRLASFEMCYVDDVPVSVSINEAVNLAKEFCGDESPRFVNGILGRIAKQLEMEEA